MNDLVTAGAFIGGIWVLSLIGLKAIRDSKYASVATQDSAAVAIVAMSIIGAGSGAYLLAEEQLSEGQGWVGIVAFLIPFVAMGVVYLCKDKSRVVPPATE
ncbi:hypothetical protein [Citricoccus sp. K5]|uniref:hypothetical protein n=1 Tax=Citricoccus sp. K5 TaxID=2653135 RepID=UPI00135C3FFF|nr:hypothetical protein [Citricoccus sp. K5]